MNKSWWASGGTYRFIGKLLFPCNPSGLCGYFNPSIPWVSPMAIDMQALRACVFQITIAVASTFPAFCHYTACKYPPACGDSILQLLQSPIGEWRYHFATVAKPCQQVATPFYNTCKTLSECGDTPLQQMQSFCPPGCSFIKSSKGRMGVRSSSSNRIYLT